MDHLYSCSILGSKKELCFNCHVPTGTDFRQRSDWAALPSQFFRDAFELQSYALDNCAAACVCKSWQAAVHGSCISALHLHTHSRALLPSSIAHWGAFLAARTCIGELKLAAGDITGHLCVVS